MLKKRIVHYIASLKDGGAQTQLILLCNNIDISKYEVFIVCCDKNSSIPVNDHVNICIIQRGSKYDLISFFRQVFKVSKRLNPDVVHLWLPEIMTIPSAVWSRWNGVKILSTERRIPVSNFGKLWLRDRLKYINHLMSNILVANFPLPVHQRSVLNFFAKRKGITIYNGLDLEESFKYKRTQFGEDFTIIYTGRFVAQKNVHIIIGALHELVKEGFDVRLYLFGDGELRDSLKRNVADLRLGSKVTFFGYVDDWKSIAVNGDVFVLPTDREGMPNVLFEAAAINLPLISSNIQEVVSHFSNEYDALIITKNEVTYLKEAIRDLMLNPDLRGKLVANASRTIKNYSIEKMVFSYENVYGDLIRKVGQ